jgi:hypothetical protein
VPPALAPPLEDTEPPVPELVPPDGLGTPAAPPLAVPPLDPASEPEEVKAVPEHAVATARAIGNTKPKPCITAVRASRRADTSRGGRPWDAMRFSARAAPGSVAPRK